jgi:hypothetical protein
MRRIFVCAALAAIAVTTAALGQGRPRIILYQEDNYRGAQLEVTGEDARIKLRNFDDRVSSVRVISGTWELCADDVFRGECIVVRRDEPRLDRLGFDDMLSSLRPIAERGDRFDRRDDRRDDRFAGGGEAITLYQDVDYRGASRGLGGEVRNLDSLGWNDRVSSIRIRSGTWELCQHENFGGRCIRVDHDVRNLVDMNFNDEISSVRRIR